MRFLKLLAAVLMMLGASAAAAGSPFDGTWLFDNSPAIRASR
jgi:hypothetical protein